MSAKSDIRSIEQRIQAVATRPRANPQGTVFPRSDYIYTAVPTSLKYMLSAEGTVIEESEGGTDTPVLYVYEADAYYKQVSQKAFDDTQDATKPIFTKDTVNGVYKAAVGIRLVSSTPLGVGGVSGGTSFRTVFCVNRGSYFESLVMATSGYPYGAEHNFGISIDGATVTVLRAVVKRGTKPYEISLGEGMSVDITTDNDWLALVVTPGGSAGDDTFAFQRFPDGKDLPEDDGTVIQLLHQFSFAGGLAQWKFGMYFDGTLPMFGH